MERMNWRVAGPIRESYLVPPGTATGPLELLTEVQIPSTFAD